jgi:hypothetical protein
VTTPSAALAPKTLEITLGSGDQAALEDPLIEAVAADGNLFVTKSDAPGKYIVQPYLGDFAKALDGVVGEQGWPLEPLQIAMRLGKGMDGWLTALRFKQLAPLQISGYEKKTDHGRSLDEIHFREQKTGGWMRIVTPQPTSCFESRSKLTRQVRPGMCSSKFWASVLRRYCQVQKASLLSTRVERQQLPT